MDIKNSSLNRCSLDFVGHSVTIAKYCTGCCMKRLSRNQSCHDCMEPTRWFKSHISAWTTDSCMKEESQALWRLNSELVSTQPLGPVFDTLRIPVWENPKENSQQIPTNSGSLTLRSASFSFQSCDNCTRQSQVTLSNRLVAPNKLSVSFTLEQWHTMMGRVRLDTTHWLW